MLALSAVCALLLAVVPNAGAGSPSAPAGSGLWPRFSTPRVVYVVDVRGMSSADLLTAITLEGIYNAQQRSSRLYLIQEPDDATWLDQIPKPISVVTLPPPDTGTVLEMLLRRFRPFIDGAIMTNSSNVDTTNLATTMAGLDHAIVTSPSQQAMIDALGINVRYSFNTAEFTADNAVQTYQWGVQHLLAQSSRRLLVMLPGNDPYHIRDYAAATGAFTFYLTSTDATQAPVGQPLFLEPLVDSWDLTPTDILHVAQQLALAGKTSGVHYVFTTPTELAMTMRRYDAGQEAGLPTANAQSVTGEQALAKPIISPPFPSGTVTITGPNLVANPSGENGTDGWTLAGGGRSVDATLSATTYQGGPALQWTDTITTTQDWIHYYPAVQNGQTYTFSVEVAGSGQIFMDVWTGNADLQTIPINLTSSYQRLTWTATIPSNAPGGQTGQAPQLQVRESGVGPVSAYIRNASVAASTACC